MHIPLRQNEDSTRETRARNGGEPQSADLKNERSSSRRGVKRRKRKGTIGGALTKRYHQSLGVSFVQGSQSRTTSKNRVADL